MWPPWTIAHTPCTYTGAVDGLQPSSTPHHTQGSVLSSRRAARCCAFDNAHGAATTHTKTAYDMQAAPSHSASNMHWQAGNWPGQALPLQHNVFTAQALHAAVAHSVCLRNAHMYCCVKQHMNCTLALTLLCAQGGKACTPTRVIELDRPYATQVPVLPSPPFTITLDLPQLPTQCNMAMVRLLATPAQQY